MTEQSTECHCGKDGHPLHSINCPVHGTEAQLERAAMWLYYAIAGYHKEEWSDLSRASLDYWRCAARECLAGAEIVRAQGASAAGKEAP